MKEMFKKPSGLLTTTGTLSEKKIAELKGVFNSSMPAMLGKGMCYTPFEQKETAIPVKKMTLIEQKEAGLR